MFSAPTGTSALDARWAKSMPSAHLTSGATAESCAPSGDPVERWVVHPLHGMWVAAGAGVLP